MGKEQKSLLPDEEYNEDEMTPINEDVPPDIEDADYDEGEPEVKEKKETALTTTTQNEILDMDVKQEIAVSEKIFEYVGFKRKIALSKLNKPKHWGNWGGNLRPRSPAVSKLLAPLGISGKIVDRGERKKEDGSTTFRVTYKMWWTKFPELSLERSGSVNTNETLYRSQIESDASETTSKGKKKESWQINKKFGKDATASTHLDQNAETHAETRAFVNCFCRLLGIEDIEPEDLQSLGIDTKDMKPWY
jgi:hypothetical protein